MQLGLFLIFLELLAGTHQGSVALAMIRTADSWHVNSKDV